MILPPFEYHQPKTVDEALSIAETHKEDFDYVAGGTDLLQNYKNRLNTKGHLISLSGIEELKGFDLDRIGALTTLHELENDPEIREAYTGTAEAASEIASTLVRETGTFGGNLLIDNRCFYFNQTDWWRQTKGSCMKAEGDACLVVPQKEICYATFSGDIAPTLMTLDATYVFRGWEGERRVKARDFYKPDGITRFVKKPGEILTHVEFPESARNLKSGYRKLRLRDTLDYPLMGAAAAVRVENGTLEELHVVINAVEMVPHDFEETCKTYVGETWTPSLIAKIADEVRDNTRPVRNVYLSPQYRKKMVGVYLKRLLSDLTGVETAEPVTP